MEFCLLGFCILSGLIGIYILIVTLIEMRKMGIHTERVKWANRLLGDRKNIIAVEIGVWKADFSKMMLESNENISCWWGVDPYMPYGRKHRKEDAWDAIYERVVKKMEPFGDRFVLVRRTSQSALSVLPRDVDFVLLMAIMITSGFCTIFRMNR